jgi:cytochrome bd-type quinol oxidase subunit 1
MNMSGSTINLIDYLKKQSKISLLLPVVSILISLFFPNDELRSFLLFVMLIPIFSLNKFDNRIIVGYGIILLLITAILNAIAKEKNIANETIILVFWLLAIGVICMIIELLKERDNDTR